MSVHFLVQGPTASGKSQLAVALARHYNGIVVNIDAMQVYQDLHILTARPDQRQLEAAPHALYGYVDAAQRYGVGQWLQDAQRVVQQADQQQQTLIFCGGSGLYGRALTSGLVDTPEILPSIRAQVAQDYLDMGHQGMIAHILDLHSEALVHMHGVVDRQRLLRAAEVVYQTHQPLVWWHARRSAPLLDNVFRIALLPERGVLYRKINQRCRIMLQESRAEVSRLLSRQLDSTLPLMRAIGVEAVRQVLQQASAETKILEQFAQQTRQYAKRQMTWLRHKSAADLVLDDFCTAQNISQLVDRVVLEYKANVSSNDVQQGSGCSGSRSHLPDRHRASVAEKADFPTVQK